MISDVEIPHPVEYLPTGDHGLLLAWSTVPPVFFLGGPITAEVAAEAAEMLRDRTAPRALLCLEDGRTVLASLAEFKFDYRYDNEGGRWIDVSGPIGGEDVDSDQEASDDGGEAVQGPLPDLD